MKYSWQYGLILKPSKHPLTMIDSAISDWAIYNGIIQGKIYLTQTIM